MEEGIQCSQIHFGRTRNLEPIQDQEYCANLLNIELLLGCGLVQAMIQDVEQSHVYDLLEQEIIQLQSNQSNKISNSMHLPTRS